MTEAPENEFRRALALSDDDWVHLIAGTATEDVQLVRSPPLPSIEIQEAFVGSSGTSAMCEAGSFYKKTVEVLRGLGWTDDTVGNILDFGCGWGRIYRFFLRHSEFGRLVGVDIDEECIALCRDAMPYGTFATCRPMPPLPFDTGTFDLATAYSVFSHLAPEVFVAWVDEFARLLRPRGVIAFTTLMPEHIDVWEAQETRGNAWDKGALRRAGFNARRWRRRLAAGEPLFVPTGGGGVRESSFYGETVLSADYLATASRSLGFSLVTYSTEGLPQAFVALQKTKTYRGRPQERAVRPSRTLVS